MGLSAGKRFADRVEAGKRLVRRLRSYASSSVVYALPRGGVIVAAEVAKELEAPLDLIIVRKIGHPYYPEYAIGAIAENNQPVFNESERREVDEAWLEATVHMEQLEHERRRREYFSDGYQPPPVKGRTAILVDDGIATGLSMEAAILAVRLRGPANIIIAVPVASVDAVHMLSELADEIIVLDDPEHFMGAVGAHYEQFPEVSDAEVVELLANANDEDARRHGRL